MPPSFETSMLLNEPPALKKLTPLVPVIDLSPSREPQNGKGKHGVKPRTYGDELLPIKPSATAPRNARITGRVAEWGQIPQYTLQIGEVQIEEVTPEEVLDYVSAFELEQFENRQFEEEREALAIAQAVAEAEEERRRFRRAESARQKGVIIFQESNDSDDYSDVETGRHGRARPKYTHLFEKVRQRRRRRKRDPITGELMDRSEDESVVAAPAESTDLPKRRRRKRHPVTGELMPLSDREAGDEDENIEMEVFTAQAVPRLSSRAPPTVFETRRPTSTPASELPKRRRRKRDPVTRELMPLSDQGEEDAEMDSSAADASQLLGRTTPSSSKPYGQADTPASEQTKRRRRKRDPITGELLPLESIGRTVSRPPVDYSSGIDHRKKPRRRRHPITGEMMPLGHRYDPNTGKMYQKPRDYISPAMRKMSISQEPNAKRVRIASESSADDFSQSRPLSSSFNPRSLQGTSNRMNTPQFAEPDDLEMDGLPEDEDQHRPTPVSKSQSTPKTSILHLTGASNAQSASSESSAEPITLQSFLKSSGRHDIDSDDYLDSTDAKAKRIMSPTHTKTSIMSPVAARPNASAKVESEDEDLDEDEWFVEAIIGHRMSDPKGYLGRQPTMLYHTKWENTDELTWEPAGSFDPSTVADYRKRVRIDKKPPPSLQERLAPVRQPMVSSKSESPLKLAIRSESSDEESEDGGKDEGYAVEKILAHHMSDPRTHPGKPQTMLYSVKWVGWEKPTWEPIGSFPDKALVNDYRRKAGLLVL